MSALPRPAPDAVATHRVTYCISATGLFPRARLLTYKVPGGSTSQVRGGKIPQEFTNTFRKGEFVYLSAQNDGGGAITVTIKVDGKSVKSVTSWGRFAIATVSGRL
jgi:hypothetical protein